MKSEYDYASKKKFVDVLNASRYNSPLPSPFNKDRMSKTLQNFSIGNSPYPEVLKTDQSAFEMRYNSNQKPKEEQYATDNYEQDEGDKTPAFDNGNKNNDINENNLEQQQDAENKEDNEDINENEMNENKPEETNQNTMLTNHNSHEKLNDMIWSQNIRP